MASIIFSILTATSFNIPFAGADHQESIVARTWHGKTLRRQADEYETYLRRAITHFLNIDGNLGYQLMRLDNGPSGADFVEFQVISYWASPAAVRAFAGADISRARELPRDEEFLIDRETFVRNYRLQVSASAHRAE